MGGTLRQLASTLGVGANIAFIGRLPQDELFRRYPDFDVLLFPSLHDSGGNVVIESLSFGLPVICLDLGGPSSFVDDSCGFIIPAHDASENEVVDALATALVSIFADPDRHRTLCRAALLRSEALTWQKQIHRVMTLVQETVKR